MVKPKLMSDSFVTGKLNFIVCLILLGKKVKMLLNFHFCLYYFLFQRKDPAMIGPAPGRNTPVQLDHQGAQVSDQSKTTIKLSDNLTVVLPTLTIYVKY